MSPAAVCVALAILRYDGSDGHCFASAATLAKTAGVSERAVVGGVKDLEKALWIRVERRTGRTHSNRIFPAYNRAQTPQMVQTSSPLKSAENDNQSLQILHPNASPSEKRERGSALARAAPHGARPYGRRQSRGLDPVAAMLVAGGWATEGDQ
ncbi:helix-turn-helix domain-containing protein [Brevundimonas naejangsanensis]|uniref:helix-turn-helix domain-containing protein n=1 Tax=Brevundimonas naejangsanensis TaxID=588932 RepID=UPI0026F3394B|nr:helix-turn-helix domain-containing protein [Brevundimonas naejangsanensis]